jgi:hypothetical protein
VNDSIKELLSRIKTDEEFQGRVAVRTERSEAKKRSERYRGAKRTAMRHYVATHPIETQARMAAKEAVRTGRLKPQQCAEHDDYCRGRLEMHHWHGYTEEH